LEGLSIASRRQSQLAKLADLGQQIAAKAGEAAENRTAIVRLRASLPFAEQKRDTYRELRRSGLTPVPTWAEAELAAAEQQRQIAIMEQHVATVAAQQASLVRQVAEARETYAHDVLKDLADAEQHVGELQQDFAAAARRAQQTVLTAPISGTVQELQTHTVGGVVQAAQTLMKIVPDDGPVLIEATVGNSDIGFVQPGQEVEVKVETFTFTRYGLLHGHVVDVSRDAAAPSAASRSAAAADGDDTDTSKDGTNARKPDAGYVAHIRLDNPVMLVDGVARRLAPGMNATAEIKTGRRRVISYLLSPLQRYAHDAGGER